MIQYTFYFKKIMIFSRVIKREPPAKRFAILLTPTSLSFFGGLSGGRIQTNSNQITPFTISMLYWTFETNDYDLPLWRHILQTSEKRTRLHLLIHNTVKNSSSCKHLSPSKCRRRHWQEEDDNSRDLGDILKGFEICIPEVSTS